MEIGSKKWIDLVLDGANELGLNINLDQVVLFSSHGKLLLQWNRKMNLTTITDPLQVAIKHFLDSVAPFAHISFQSPLLDMGTGGGFPGIPIKVLNPEQSITLVDSLRKRISFVKEVIRQLQLDNIDAIHTRVEDLVIPIGGYAMIACRAFTDMEDAVRMAAPLLAPKGRIILYQGPKKNKSSLPQDQSIFRVDGKVFRRKIISYQLPFLGDERRISILELDE